MPSPAPPPPGGLPTPRPIGDNREALDARTAFYTAVVEKNRDGFCLLDMRGRLLEVNDAYVQRSGYTREQLLTMTVEDLDAVDTNVEICERLSLIAREGRAFFESFHRTAAGTVWPVEVNAAYVDESGGRLLVFLRDVTADRRSEALLRSRLRLSELASRASLGELLRAVVDQAELFTASRLAFFHFVDPDEQHPALFEWSTAAADRLGEVAGSGRHGRDVASVWLDCVKSRRPVICNDRPAVPRGEDRETREPLRRTLAVPVMRQGEVVAVIGVANKHADYTEADAEVVSAFATMTMELIDRVRAEERLRDREEQYRLALQAGQIGTFRHVFAERSARLDELAMRHLGVTTPVPTLDEIHARVHPDDVVRVLAEIERSRRPDSGGRYEIEHRVVDTDGRVRWIAVRAQVYYAGAERREVMVIGTSRDVTEHRLALQAAEQSEARYRSLTETTFDWVWQLDVDGRYIDVSPRVRDLFGYEPEELIGRSPLDFMAPRELAHVQTEVERVLAARAPFSGLENARRRKDGTELVIETSGVPVIAPDGRFMGFRGVGRDITGRKLAERRLAAQAEIGHLLAESSSIADALVDVLRVLCETEGWQYGGLWARDPDETVLRCLGAWHAPEVTGQALVDRSRALTFARGEGLPGRTWAAGDVQIAGPEHVHAMTRGLEMTAAGLSHAIAFPLRLRGEVSGVIECSSRQPIVLDDRRTELLGAIGNDLGLYLERRRAQEQLERFVAGSPSVLFVLRRIDGVLRTSWVSENVQALTGYTPAEAMAPGWRDEVIHVDDKAKASVPADDSRIRSRATFEFRVRRKDGRWIWVREDRRLLGAGSGGVVEIVRAWSDVTERVDLEEQLRQSQKLEAIGQLAGGVAHDFNNLLTVITGYSEMLLGIVGENDDLRAPLADIHDAGERAAALTRQLLAFSRKQVLEPRVVDLNASVAQMEKLLRRLIGEDIVLATVLSPTLSRVLVDPGQVEQVILNLAVNSRDAMPKGGRLTIETRDVSVDAAHCRINAGARPGRFVRLSVTDTGLGMSAEVKQHIFEPFFTTKAPGRGTGLGLATVFGLVAQSNGWIEVESAPGAGARFDVYLPLAPTADGRDTAGRGHAVAGGRETILIVEDEAGVRNVARRALELQGYRVLEADSLELAVRLFAEAGTRISLVVTDIVMPGGSGRELAERLRAAEPGLKVLFMSGYTDDAVIRHGVSEMGAAFLQKPFSPLTLAQRVRDMLDAPAGA